MTADCPRAKSSMTPCVLRDGKDALADDGACVGCLALMTSSESPTHPDAPRAGGETPTAVEALAERAAYTIERLRAVSESVNAGHDRYIPNDADDAADLIAELRASLLERHRDGEREPKPVGWRLLAQDGGCWQIFVYRESAEREMARLDAMAVNYMAPMRIEPLFASAPPSPERAPHD